MTKKRKQPPAPGGDASTAEAVPGRVGNGEQGEALRANTTPNGGPHLELARLRLKTWFKYDFSFAETCRTYLYICLSRVINCQAAGHLTVLPSIPPPPAPDEYEYYSEDDDTYSSGEEDQFEHLPWSEGGEGGIGSLGLGEHLHEDGDARSKPSAMFRTPRYSEEELNSMLDTLYGEGGGGKLVGPGAWGKGRWRPEGDASDST